MLFLVRPVFKMLALVPTTDIFWDPFLWVKKPCIQTPLLFALDPVETIHQLITRNLDLETCL